MRYKFADIFSKLSESIHIKEINNFSQKVYHEN